MRVSEIPSVEPLHWNQVAATFSHGRVVLYLNGEEILAGTTKATALVPNEHPLLIGEAQALSGPRSYLFAGLIDNVRLYSRALSGDELSSLYAQERQGKTEEKLSIEAPMPEGYDPEFKTKLPLVAAYEKQMPDPASREQVSASVAPYGGVPTLHIDSKPVYSMAMMPEPYVSDDLITLSCRDFAAAGVDIYSEIFWSWMTVPDGCSGWWLGEGE